LVSQVLSLSALSDVTDPNNEAIIMKDFSHIALDFTTIFGPESVLVRLIVVFGHLLSMGADFELNHAMEENPAAMVYNHAMLAIAVKSFVQSMLPAGYIESILPLLQSEQLFNTEFTKRVASYRNRRTYALLFKPMGVSWAQFQALKLNTLEWVTVEPETLIAEEDDECPVDYDDNDYFYWLYSGSVEVEKEEDGDSYCMEVEAFPKLRRSRIGQGLIGDDCFAQCIEYEMCGIDDIPSYGGAVFPSTPYLSSIDFSNSDDVDEEIPRLSIIAGEKGATLLRFSAKNLLQRMNQDEDLAKSMRLLSIKGMQDKIEGFADYM